MNRRLLLAVCAALPMLLPHARASAQLPQAGGAASRGDDERSSDERDRKHRRTEFGGLAIGGGLALAFGGGAETVTQQDYCLGACTPLRAIGPRHLDFGQASATAALPLTSAPEGAKAKRSGVMALLNSAGSLVEDASDVLPSGKALASDGRLGNETAAANRSKHVDRVQDAPHDDLADIVVAPAESGAFGCITGCGASSPVFEGAVDHGSNGLFALSAPGGASLNLAAEVGTIVNPEPGTVALTLVGLLAMAGVARRKRSQA